MTSANGTTASDRRRPSAASRSAVARGALPPGPPVRTIAAPPPWRRGLGVVLLVAGLVAAPAAVLSVAAPARAAGPEAAEQMPTASPPAAGPRQRPVGRRTAARQAAAEAGAQPRLPDAPQDLLPAANPYRRAGADALPPRAACLAAARRAEGVHGLPEGLMVAIALSESGLHAYALNIGGRAHFPEDGATARALLARAGGRSVMAGCVQVNARVHARGSDWPLDAERAADWAGGLLRRWYRETGSWTTALARWHGGSPASTRRVLCRVRAKLEVTAPGSDVLGNPGCSGTEIARVRRSGATLLEIAEAR